MKDNFVSVSLAKLEELLTPIFDKIEMFIKNWG